MKLAPYARAYQQNSVQIAGPGQLILMLFDGALRFMHAAVAGFDHPDVIQRNEAVHINLVKTQAIIDELQTSLNMEAGGEFAKTMSDLYEYFRTQLRTANMKKDVSPVAVVIELVTGLRNSWSSMLDESHHSSEQFSLQNAA